MSIGTNIDSAISGLFSGVEKAKAATSDLSRVSNKLAESDDSAKKSSSSSSGSEQGKGGSIDVTV